MKTQRVVKAVAILGAFTVLLLCARPLLAQQSAEDLYQTALYQEEVQGDLKGAIEIYERILADHPQQRSIAAQALMHVGLCYEKLGSQEARRAYERLLRDYADQTAMASRARERLAGLDHTADDAAARPHFRPVRIPSRPQNGVLSPSGDSLAFVSQGSLWVVPLHSDVGPDVPGEPVAIAEGIGAWDEATLLSWSADGKWIAVNSENPDPEGSVYVVPVAGGQPRVLEMPPRGGHAYSYRVGLSPDGQSLVFTALTGDSAQGAAAALEERYVYLTSTNGGEPRRLTSGWGRTPAVSPDGELVAFVRPREREDWPGNEARGRYDGDLWIVPVAGGRPVRLATVDGQLAGPVWSRDGRFIAARYEDGRTNRSGEFRVYPLNAERSSAGDPIRIALPRTSGDMIAGWTANDELGVFMLSESHEAIYTVPSAGGKAVQVSPDTTWSAYPRWSTDGGTIFFRWVTGNAEEPVAVGRVASAGGAVSAVPVQSERRFMARYPGGGASVSPDGRRLVFSAARQPYRQEEGVDLWVVPLDGDRASRLTEDPSFEGYPVWTPDGEWVVFLDRVVDPDHPGDGYSAVFRVPAQGGEAKQLTSRRDSVSEGPVAVSPDGRRIAFLSNGAFRTMPMTGGATEVLLDAVEADRYSDLAWSPDGTRIAYSGAGKIWIAPGDGSGRPVELNTGLPVEAELATFSWSPDGRRIAFCGMMGGEDELWLISDFLPKRR